METCCFEIKLDLFASHLIWLTRHTFRVQCWVGGALVPYSPTLSQICFKGNVYLWFKEPLFVILFKLSYIMDDCYGVVASMIYWSHFGNNSRNTGANNILAVIFIRRWTHNMKSVAAVQIFGYKTWYTFPVTVSTLKWNVFQNALYIQNCCTSYHVRYYHFVYTQSHYQTFTGPCCTIF